MNRYIDANMLIKKYIDTDIEKFSNSDVKIVFENLKQNILKAPSIDIVRCDECQYYEDGHCESAEMWQSINGYTTECESMSRNADDFCSYGEREGE